MSDRIPRPASLRSFALAGMAVLGLALVAAAITVLSFNDQSTREADARLDRHVRSVADDLSLVFSDASRDLRLARLNSTYDRVVGASTIGPADRTAIETGISYVAERYNVDEICLIRANGQETARWNGGQVASVSTLSSDERGNPFFVPTMGLANDAVHVTEPYVSPDTHRWVYGFATPIVLPSGSRGGVLHFEIPLQRLADRVATEPFGSGAYVVVVDRAGRILVDPEHPALGRSIDTGQLPLIGADSAPWQAIARAATSGAADSGMATFDDRVGTARVAYRVVPATDLVVLSVSPTAVLYADVERTRLNLVATVGPLIALILLVSGWFAVRLTRSNGRLATATRASSELASIVESADDAILSVEADGRIATWNGGAEAMYGRVPADAIGQRLDVLFADHPAELPGLLTAVMAGTPVDRHEAVHRREDGSTLTVWLTFSPIRASRGDVVGASVIARDISDRKRLEEELANQALHDSLTGLPNRVLFHDRLRQSLNQGNETRVATGRHAVLFVDLDEFKLINDTLGHRIGDELLVAVAVRLREAIRSIDTAARLGGDEFTILLENVGDPAEAAIAADRILEHLRRPFELDGHQIVVSASIGIAFGDAGSDDPDDVLRCADTALYEAKGRGKGRHETYQHTMNVRAWHRLELESELRLAITRGELLVEYQPIVELDGGRIDQVEALVRWQHPTRGLMSPADFIPIAEQTGLIGAIGDFVLDQACADLVAWQQHNPAAHDLSVSVNVSPRDFVRPAFVQSVVATLARYGFAGQRLTLEITETTALDVEAARGSIDILRDHGVRVVIDDFGTGYSSLGYFRELAIDGLKIDRVFIEGLGLEREATAIVTAAMAFGSALGIEVIAEGIESELQRARLGELGCRLGQGFLLARPVAPSEIANLLEKRRRSTAA